MHDSLYALAVITLTFSALAVFALRSVIRGVVRYDRVDAVGGSPLLSQRLVEFGYWAVLPAARACARAGITPNHITWMSLGLGVAAGVAISFGLLGLGALLALLSALGDCIDGQVARMTKTGSPAGEVLDASVDRYMEFFYIGGLVLFYRDSVPCLVVAMFALLAAFMVSYATAKAEAMGVEPPRGAMRRHERSTYLIAGCVFSSLLSPWLEPFPRYPELRAIPAIAALILIATVGNYSAARRLWLTAKALRERASRGLSSKPPAA
jgi:CDP-diacylglycerol---glycerol-3-phosphate 3-phosphatidyltransferase